MPVGDYRLRVECDGFSPSAMRLTLAVGAAADVRVTLRAGGPAETVEVGGGDTLVEAARTQVSETVTPREVDALPLNGRNYLDLALLLPGVSRTNTGSVQRFAETSAGAGTGISVAGPGLTAHAPPNSTGRSAEPSGAPRRTKLWSVCRAS